MLTEREQAKISLRVPPEADGVRLDRFLAEPLGSRARAQSLIDSARVLVDGRPKAKRYLVRHGQLIEVDDVLVLEQVQEGPPAPYTVAYEDEYLLVVDKPAGVVVHPGRGNRTGTLAQALHGVGAGGEEPWRAGIVHRLDRDTSGLLVVAKDDAIHRALKRLLQQRRLHREYLALVEGYLESRSGTIDAPIGRDRRNPTLMSIDAATPREARTHFEIEQLLAGVSLVRVTLETGRTHQIRVHFAAIEHPVVGDAQYGGPELYGLKRQFLHATRLAFPHPATSEQLDVSAPLPPDLEQVLAVARER